ncbi:MAG: metallophosphoesterase [Myxococcota bacterium]
MPGGKRWWSWRRALLATGVLAALAGVWAVLVEPGWWRVDRTTVALPRLDPRLDGLKIAVLTDLHVGAPHINLRELEEIVAATNAASPDLVVILGDLVIHGVQGGTFVEPEPIAGRLAQLEAPLGVVAVLGNHDWWYDGPRVTQALRDRDIVVLDDDAVALEHTAPLWVAGVGDLWTRNHDIDRALRDVPPDATCVLITHNPDIFVDVPDRVALTLAGHTHGGQVRFPLVGAPVVPSKYGNRFAADLVVEDGRHLFVSVGIGTSILPVRFGVHPRVDLLTLEAPGT